MMCIRFFVFVILILSILADAQNLFARTGNLSAFETSDIEARGSLSVCLCTVELACIIGDRSHKVQDEIFLCLSSNVTKLSRVLELRLIQQNLRADRIAGGNADKLTWVTCLGDNDCAVRTRLDPAFVKWRRRKKKLLAQGVVVFADATQTEFEVSIPIQYRRLLPPPRGETLVLYIFFSGVSLAGLLVLFVVWDILKERRLPKNERSGAMV